MDKETIVRYAPFAVVVITIILQWNMFVTPAQIEIKHREILQEVAQTYATKEQTNDFKKQLNDIQVKVDKMYDIMVRTGAR